MMSNVRTCPEPIIINLSRGKLHRGHYELAEPLLFRRPIRHRPRREEAQGAVQEGGRGLEESSVWIAEGSRGQIGHGVSAVV